MNDELLEDLRIVGKEKDVKCIIVFGSVARGETDERSDVDVCIIMNRINDLSEEQISNKILNLEKKYNKNIQVIFTDKKFEKIDRNLLENILSEGLLLAGEIPPISLQKLELQPFAIIKYDLSGLAHAQKMAIKRELYGQTTFRKHKGKTYKSEKKGLVDKLGAERIGIASLMVNERSAKIIENFLEENGAKIRRIRIWISRV